MSNQSNENAALSIVQVNAPAPGAQVVVDASGAGRLVFDFDISSASMSRSGNDLLFEMDNGGSVRVSGFFAPADGMSLPEFVLADQTVVDSKDLLAAYDIDVTPAASAVAPGSGLGAYDSDAGNLIGGLDRSGDLDPFFWGGAAGREEDYTNNRYPGGSFDFSISTGLGDGAFSAIAFEDGRPFQYQGDDSLSAARINMNINPNSGSTVGEIRFSGLPAGAQLYLGDPANGGVLLTPGADGVYRFNSSNFSGNGVYIVPPADSDADITINVSVDFSDSGRTASVDGSFTVVVDAVADRPDYLGENALNITNDQHSMSATSTAKGFVDGYNKQAATVSSDAGEGKVSVTLNVSSQFFDYDSADGSETHYVLVELPAGFTAPENYQIYTDESDGGRQYIMIPADGKIDPATGQATVEVTLETASYSSDTAITLKTGSMSVESATDRDFNTDNDVSVVIPGEVSFNLDVVDAALNISIGWASEGNNASAYLASGSGHSQDFDNMDDVYGNGPFTNNVQGVESASTADGLGAPIVIELDGASGSGSANTITQVVLTVEAGRGALVDGSGNVIEPDSPGGNTYTFNGAISGGEVYFRPDADSYDHSDVSIGYQVTVNNGEGATAVYTGTAGAVVDAVADFAPVSNMAADYGSDTYGAMSAAKPGGTVELKMDVNFPDTTAGNENHYVLIAAGVGNIDAYGACTITDAGGNVVLTVDLSDLTPVDGYYQVAVPASYSDVKVSVEVTVSDSLAADTNIPVSMGSKTEVIEPTTNANKEYDAENNTSINVSDVNVNVAPANAAGSSGTVNTYEADASGNVMPNKHGVTGTLTVYDGTNSISGGKITVSDADKLGDITFSLSSGGDSTEYFTQIQFTIAGNLDDLGSLALKGASAGVTLSYSYDPVSDTTTVTIMDALPSDSSVTVKFTPASFSDVDLEIMDYELDFINSKSHDAGNVSVDGGGDAVKTVVVDAVAAKATGLDAEDPVYNGTQAQAKAGEEVKVSFEMQVPETVGDANETHCLTLKVDGNSGYNSVTLHGEMGGDLVITFTAPGTLKAGQQATNIQVNGQPSSDFTVEIITINNVAYYKISGAGFEAYLDQVHGDVSGEVSFDAALSGTAQSNGDYKAGGSVGLLIIDAEGDGSSSSKNNVSYSETTYSYEVGGVASAISMSVTNAYENAVKDANLQFVSRESLLSAIENAATDSDAAEAAINQLKAGSSAITISGAAADESITKAVFVADYSGLASEADAAPGQFMYQGVLIDVPTSGPVTVGDVQITCKVDTDGQVTITLEGDDIDLSAGNLYFVPGENYNHNDVTINYGITVTDNDSLQNKEFASDQSNPDLFSGSGVAGIDYDPNEGDAAVVKVDAVAQRPDITDVSIDVLPGADANTIAHGGTAAINVNVDLHGDFDGTEGHIFYVRTEGNAYPVESIVIHYSGADGNEYSFTVSESDIKLQQTNLGGQTGGAYNYSSIDLEAVINTQVKADPDNYKPLGNGEVTVTVNVGTPSSGSGSTVDFGVSSHEDWYEVQQGWEAGSGDKELSSANNNAWNSGSVAIILSSASRPSMSLDKVAFYENNNAAANTGEYDPGTGIPLSFNFGDANDILTGFNVSLNGANAELGDLIMFGSTEFYNEFVAAVQDSGDPNSANYGKSAYEILDEFIAEGKAQNMGDEITFGDITSAGLVGTNGEGDLTGGFTGKIVFMPAEDSYSGQDPSIDCTIVVRDDASGQYASNGGYKGDSENAAAGSGSSASLLADAVAQKPDTPELGADSGSSITLGGERTVTITATFGDTDSSTEHYILVEAKAGWTLIYQGHELSLGNLETYQEGGTVYYKIPVTPTPDGGDSNSGTASIEVTLKAPTNALYYQDGYDYDFEVRAGSTDKDLSGDELTFHNNTAISDTGGSLSGTVTGGGSGSGGSTGNYHFAQTAALYEDNNPDSHLAGDDPNDAPVGGTFSLGSENCPNGYVIIECPMTADGDPVFSIEGAIWDSVEQGWRVELDANGNADISVTLSDAYLADSAHNDADLNFEKITFYNESGAPQEVIDNNNGQLDVVVDAVADRADLQGESIEVWDSATGAHRLDDAVAGGASDGGSDFTAKFTVNAVFPDTGGERHYILVEKIPAWEYDGSAEEVHLDGKTYYKIDVTGEVQNDGSLSFEVGMTYVGARVDIFGEESWQTDANGDPVLSSGGKIAEEGVTAYELSYGTMSQEGVSDSETELQNNVAVNLEGNVTLKYSPVTSSVSMGVNSTSNVEGVGNTITLQLNQIDTENTQDTLIDLSISYSPSDGSAGTLYLVNGQGSTLYEISSGHQFSDAELANLSTDGYKLVFEQNDYNHQDISFSWSGTVKDIVSGATESTSGGTTIIMDAAAQASTNDYTNNSDGSIVVADQGTGATGVLSGNSALVTITANFPDAANVDDPSTPQAEGSEEHWVVLEQGDLDYSVLNASIYVDSVLENDNATVVTKFGPDGTPYFAVQVPAGADVKVVFEVTTPAGLSSDTQISLNGGTITIENTKDGSNSEPSYDNNWTGNIGKDSVEIQVGVLETQNVTVTAETNISEGGYSQLSFAGIDAAYNEAAVITITELPQGVELYTLNSQSGVYEIVSSVPLTITYHNENGVMVPDQDYYLKADEHYSGSVTIKYTAEVTDVRTGETASIPEQSAIFNIKGVASGSALDDTAYSAEQDNVNTHAASVTITPTFDDTDGSEAHYLLFAVPSGMTVEGATTFTLSAADADRLGLDPGTYYRIDVTGNSGNALTINLNSVSGSYDAANDEIKVWSMSAENSNFTTDGKYAVSGPSVISVDDLNSAIEIGQPYSEAVSAGTDWTVCGDLGLASMFSDPDGDGLSYSFNYGGGDYALDPVNGVDLPGEYGTLHIDADGTYTYTPNDGEANDSFYLEDFTGITVTATDGYGSSVTNTADITFDVSLGTLYGGADGDILAADESGMTVYGGAGDDTIYAYDGGSVIFGGIGNDTIYADDGSDIFAWRAGDLENGGLDTIVGFDLDNDKLFIEGLLSAGGNDAEHENTISGLLNDGDLLLSMQDSSTITLKYEGQTVELQLNSSVDQDTFNAMSDDSGNSDAAKTQLLMSILNSSM